MYTTLGSHLKIMTCGHLNKKYTSISWENDHIVESEEGNLKKEIHKYCT